jgi:hypothetical protein
MDHHLNCVDRILRRISQHRDIRSSLIRISDLQEAILELGFISRILVKTAPANAVGLEALFYRERYDDGRKEMAVILVSGAPELAEPDRRIRIAKELSHIFDREDERTRTASEINEHLSGLISEKVLQGTPARVDENARLLAIEMLIPYERRVPLLAGLVTHETVEQLAIECCVPVEYARIALDPAYNDRIVEIRTSAGIEDIYPA